MKSMFAAILVCCLCYSFVPEKAYAIATEHHQENQVSLEKLKEAVERISNDLQRKEGELEKTLLEFKKQIRVEDRRSGYAEKYRFELYPSESFYRSTTPSEITAYARLAQNVYEAGQNSLSSSKFSDSALNKMSKIRVLKQLLIKLEDIKEEVFSSSLDVKKFRKKLSAIFDFEDYEISSNQLVTQDKIIEAVLKIEKSLRAQLTGLELEYAQEEDPFAKVLRNLPSLSIDGPFRDAKILTVIRRNNGEFSGIVIYSEHKDEVVVVFAGTKSWSDWFKNFQYWGAQGDPIHGIGRGLNVHQGVMKVVKEGLNGVVTQISSLIKNHNLPKVITTTGHSLAGGLSTLFAKYVHDLIKNNDPTDLKTTKIRNISFASLRIVDEPSAKKIEETLGKGNILRFWNSWDLVPALTPGVMNSKHVGLDFMIQDSIFREIYKPIINWHSMQFYYNNAGETFEKIVNQANERSVLEKKIFLLKSDIQKGQQQKKDLEKVLDDYLRSHHQDELDELDLQIEAFTALIEEKEQALAKLKDHIDNLRDEEIEDLSDKEAEKLVSRVKGTQEEIDTLKDMVSEFKENQQELRNKYGNIPSKEKTSVKDRLRKIRELQQ